jgi:hypothetical protein
MPSLSFSKQFAAAVESGQKRQTIRAERRHPIKVGDRLFLYTGMRTKACRKLGEVVCTNVKPVSITWQPFQLNHHRGHWPVVKIGESVLDGLELDAFAKADGFAGFEDFMQWFVGGRDEGRTFTGQLIEWEVGHA